MAISAGALQVPNGDDTADFGDFVSNEDEELDLEEIVEPWHKYDMKTTPHVFYPICVGEVLNERYLVEHKIGSGGFSTVWMAHDLQDSRDVALKVMSLGEWGENEARMQGEIRQNVYDTSHLVTSLTTFLLPGNGCQHRVLVFPLMGPCLQPSILRNMPMATRMSAAKQLLEALENLHKGGIIHRDLNDRNCMWGMVPLHDLSRSAKYKALGRPLKQIIPFVDLWKEGELVGPAKIPENLRTEEFYLGDFGLAVKLGDPVPRGYPPMQFCSPDRLHRKGPSFACDMWSYMILFAELYLGYPPFPTHLKGGIISGIIRCLGPLPEEWKGLYTHPGSLDSWYDQQKTSDPDHDLASTIAYFCPEADPVEQKHVHSIMSSVFSYYPENRLTATQLLQDPSFRAIMHKYGF
ncbi:protein kinase [Histoplasma capsulatum G186AR]|uniref:Protein kinase n=1 Tax=Ajellomyces capsulatus (strain G186AR / H82 / ATCC MYA-2454 / RMSCC 2432) TaxID=447093 RepID=C0P0Z4_AJECG|nr:protein kinase [Histoplasma capsulatum G186AR]EEH02630.1 protein kinase [Histoplasma capsulatum G186AR]QSS70940.1 protein kinase [Histoplasma capsulatum G186AR]